MIRGYCDEDYEQLKELYLDSSLYGGQFDENRDARERLKKHVAADKEAILVVVENDEIVGSVSLIENGRVAWLFRFVVGDITVAQDLLKEATRILRSRGHKEVLVYGPESFQEKYKRLGFTKGNTYTCFYTSL